MLDPVTTPLLVLVLGKLADEIIFGACKDHLKDKVKSVFGWLESLGEKDKVEHAYLDTMEQVYASCLEMLLVNIRGFGYTDEELKEYAASLKAFIGDGDVAGELLRFVREPRRDDLPSPDVLVKRWKELGGRELPSDALWNQVAVAFRRQAKKRIILSDDLRDLLNAQNLDQLCQLIARQGGVKTLVRRDKYSQRMCLKYSPVDLANLMPACTDDPGRVVIRDVFVAQNVRENPLAVEIPKDIRERLEKKGHPGEGESADEDLDEQQLEKLRTAYVSQTPKPVLDVIAAPGNRLLVLTGEPGSGKSTLMRYLLTGIIEPPINARSGKPLAWTEAFKEVFPLLIELRDFYALRRNNECDSFLKYVDCMGKTDQWFLDQHALNDYLNDGPSLVMFDGLDEIFDTADRERVTHEIAGFAQRYPRARIIVTSRPLGYKGQILRAARFAHFGIQDLDDGQIEFFVRGWFALMFPQDSQQANQRIERVLGSVRQSKPIRLLGGNPMLLTIMALLAREQELPRERAKFYEKAVEVLCHHWDANRNLELPDDRYLNPDDKKLLLRRIAMRMQASEGGLKGNFINEDDLEQEIQAFLVDEQWQADPGEARKAARRMIRQLRERNYILCLRGPKLYGFVHRTFVEYLMAAEYVLRFDRQPQQMTITDLVKLFEKHCRDSEWREVLRLICAQIDEQYVACIVERLATRMDLERWDGKVPLPELSLAMWCLSEVRNSRKMTATRGILVNAAVIFCRRARRLAESLEQEIIAASVALGPDWTGDFDLMSASHQIEEADWTRHGLAQILWPSFVATTKRGREDVTGMLSSNTWTIRLGAIRALGQRWTDEKTRRLLERHAIEDAVASNRGDALRVLAEKWPDESARKLLQERALVDEHEEPRRIALAALAETWPDENTRKLLEERATTDHHKEPRRTALRALAAKWADENARKLLEARATHDSDDYIRSDAIRTLAENWPDDRTREVLVGRVLSDSGRLGPSEAIRMLGRYWADQSTRRLLEEFDMTKDEYVCSVVLRTLAERWPDRETMRLLERHVESFEMGEIRRKIERAMESLWKKLQAEGSLDDAALQPKREG